MFGNFALLHLFERSAGGHACSLEIRRGEVTATSNAEDDSASVGCKCRQGVFMSLESMSVLLSWEKDQHERLVQRWRLEVRRGDRFFHFL